MKKIIITIVGAFLLVSCVRENLSGAGELGVSANLPVTVSTRAVTDAFSSGHSIAVFVVGEGYMPKVVRYTFDGARWNSPVPDSEKIYLSSKVATVYGYYPGSADINGGVSDVRANAIDITVNASEPDFMGEGQTDYMYATGASNGSVYPLATASNESGRNNADLYLHHALSCLNFVINKSESYTGEGRITEIKLTATGGTLFYAGSGRMDVSDGALIMDSQSASLSSAGVAWANKYTATPSNTVIARRLVVPQASTSGIILSVAIDGRILSGMLPSAAPADRWEAGRQYTYTVLLTGSGSAELQMKNVSILDWENIFGGAAEVH